MFNETIRSNTARFIASDIIDKVLLRDLPSLYGIQDIQELNRLFLTLAYNSGNEISLDNLSKESGVAKNTIKRYLEYLEAAFLLRRVYRVDHTARRFQRETTFNIYLANPTMRAALFGPVSDGDLAMGPLTETAIFSQWFHSTGSVSELHYARWKGGEVDIVHCPAKTQKPLWAMEVKWSDHPVSHSEDLDGLIEFCKRHNLLRSILVTTKTFEGTKKFGEAVINFRPSSLHAYVLGRNTARRAANELLKREFRPEKETGVPGVVT